MLTLVEFSDNGNPIVDGSIAIFNIVDDKVVLGASETNQKMIPEWDGTPNLNPEIAGYLKLYADVGGDGHLVPVFVPAYVMA